MTIVAASCRNTLSFAADLRHGRFQFTVSMKYLIILFSLFILTVPSAVPHGLGDHFLTADDERVVARDQHSLAEKSLTKPVEVKPRWWRASLATGWTNREMHYGVDETGPHGAYTTELALSIEKLKLSVWSGFGTGNEYQEWDFTIAYTFGSEKLFFTPGYNFRYQPGVVAHEYSESVNHDHEADEDHQHADHGEDHDGPSPRSGTFARHIWQRDFLRCGSESHPARHSEFALRLRP